MSIRGLLLLVAVGFASPSHAAWVTELNLQQVGSGDAGGEYSWFQTSQTHSNPAGCSSSEIYIVRTLPKTALAILLAAHTSGKRIRAFIYPAQCDAYTGRPIVKEVAIQD